MESTPKKLELITKYFDDFSENQLKQLTLIYDLYREWNTKINVVSRKDIDSIYLHHILHSLSIAAIVEFEPGMNIIDIGCGGGFPGVPLAIFFPEVKFPIYTLSENVYFPFPDILILLIRVPLIDNFSIKWRAIKCHFSSQDDITT